METQQNRQTTDQTEYAAAGWREGERNGCKSYDKIPTEWIWYGMTARWQNGPMPTSMS